MRILFLNSIERDTYGGMEEWVRICASGLADRGHTVAVAGRKDSLFLTRAAAADPGIHIVDLNIAGDFDPLMVYRLSSLLKREGIDVIIANFNKDIRLGGLAARLNGGTRVVWSPGVDLTKDSFMHRVLTPRLIDGVIVPSDMLRQQMCSKGYLGNTFLEVIPVGIQSNGQPHSREAARRELLARYGLSQDALVGVTAGRLVEEKGHRFLLEAMPLVLQEQPKFVLLILGSGPLEVDLKRLAVAKGVAQQVVFAGHRESIQTELYGADVFIHPSLADSFPLAILEAMRAGLPVLSTTAGGIPEMVRPGIDGILMPPADTPKLARALVRLLSDAELRQSLASEGQRRVHEEFSTPKMLDRIEKFLSAVVGRRGSHEPV